MGPEDRSERMIRCPTAVGVLITVDDTGLLSSPN